VSEYSRKMQDVGIKKIITELLFAFNYLITTKSLPGYPPPEYRWMKDGSFLSERFSPEHFLKIQSALRRDSGEYRCYARNEAGTVVSEGIPVQVACE